MTFRTKLVGVGVALTIAVGALCYAASSLQLGWPWLTFGTVIIGAALVAGVPALVGRDMVNPVSRLVGSLSENAAEVTVTAAQVATSAQSLSQGATEQAASLEASSASMEEMASMTRQTAENAQRAATLVTSVAQQVEQSNGALSEMVASMGAI